jgi:uncharacterized protein (UPF0332 family)
MMSFEECKKRGQIRMNHHAINRVSKEIIIAERFLTSAENVITIKEYDLTIISSYNSCFHFLRALLFKNNYVEKSHFCLIEAIKEFYKTDEELRRLLLLFDQIRSSRHEIQYGGVFSDKEEAEYILGFNKELRTKVLLLLA